MKILDCSAVVAGPWASSILADMGAEVIWIERAESADVMRLTGPVVDDQSGCWVSMHRNKRGMAMNLRDPRAVDIIKQLAAEADIFIQNFRPGVAGRLGIAYDDLAAINPDLIYLSISGFGPDGPYADQPVYDPIVQGLSGMAHAQGGDFVKTILVDKTTAMTAANALLAAYIARSGGAGGQHIQLSLLESIFAWMWPDVYWNESLPDEEVNVPSYSVWYSPYDTSDGQVSAVWVSYGQFQGAACAVGRPDVAEDPRFATRGGRLEHALAMRAEFGKALAGLTTEEALAALRSVDVPCAPVLDRAGAMADPQVQHMKILVEADHPTAGRTITVRPPANFSKTPTGIRNPSPGRSEHTDEVLAELGLDQTAISALRDEGVVL
ncbi:MAG: crotonobetainyl-CoA:carnitine CoA-transferase CaiB-like acyl-CoA transferase [Acidimicrobiales bacterium]